MLTRKRVGPWINPLLGKVELQRRTTKISFVHYAMKSTKTPAEYLARTLFYTKNYLHIILLFEKAFVLGILFQSIQPPGFSIILEDNKYVK